MSLESSSSDEELLFLWISRASKKKRKYWVHPINTTREEQGEFSNIFLDLLKDEQRFYNYFRMSINSFNELYNIIKSDIEKQNTNWRKYVSSKERLVIFLRFLATGDTFKTIGHSYRMGSTTVGKIVRD
ncbi:putative nuclease HARBI1 like protein [Danaus plexippus plexippus]|uniref:Nuclease HARBI1 like protein n=1 Tax=Danaus plexippus plexippus TaxID=278856 RepID=A0A212ESI3_DANPL|nr:putative nuclease HARBI1 like protein [Danaus plexippus plexippus]